jgi:hypothetical protein
VVNARVSFFQCVLPQLHFSRLKKFPSCPKLLKIRSRVFFIKILLPPPRSPKKTILHAIHIILHVSCFVKFGPSIAIKYVFSFSSWEKVRMRGNKSLFYSPHPTLSQKEREYRKFGNLNKILTITRKLNIHDYIQIL